jgi:hypothetical protein
MTSNSHEQAPRLERTLGLGSVVAIGVAYTTPLIVLGIFGVVAEQSNGTVPTAYLVTLIAIVFTADTDAKIIGVVWLVIGVALLAWLTRGFRKGSASIEH